MKRFTHVFLFLMTLLLLVGCSEFNDVMEKSNKYLDMRIAQIESGEDCCCNCEDDGVGNVNDDTDDTGVGMNNEAEHESSSTGMNNDEDKDNANNDNTPEFEESEYESDQGEDVVMEFGELAFATSVVDFIVGDPAPYDDFLDAAEALGEPDFDKEIDRSKGFVSLGGSGELILEFEHVYLVDGPGDDLFIFEIGPAVEPMDVAISEDGVIWVEIGKVEGGQSSVDIEPFVEPGDKFSFVRLIDLRHDVGMPSPGADIDAVGIMNGQLK